MQKPRGESTACRIGKRPGQCHPRHPGAARPALREASRIPGEEAHRPQRTQLHQGSFHAPVAGLSACRGEGRSFRLGNTICHRLYAPGAYQSRSSQGSSKNVILGDLLILQSNSSRTESQPALFARPGCVANRLLRKGKGSILKAFPQGKAKICYSRRVWRRRACQGRLTSLALFEKTR
jgi:hypothetical protein